MIDIKQYAESAGNSPTAPASTCPAPFVVAFLYLLAALTMPSLLQASVVGLAVLAWALWRYPAACGRAFVDRHRAWLAIAAALLAGVLFSEVPLKSVKGAYDALRAMALYPLAAGVLALCQPQRAAVIAAATLPVMALVLLIICVGLQLQAGSVFLRDSKLLESGIGNLHELANLAAVLFIALLCLRVTASGLRRRHRSWITLAATAALLVLLATTSRGNLVAVILCSLTIALAGRHHGRQWSGAALVLVFIAYTALMLTYQGSCRESPCLDDSLAERQHIADASWRQSMESPWLGHGINSFKYVSGITSMGQVQIMPHNIYLELLYSSGVLGSLLFLAGLTGLLRTNATEASADAPAKKPPVRFVPLLGNVLLVYIAVRGLVDLKLFSYETLGLICIAAGMRNAD